MVICLISYLFRVSTHSGIEVRMFRVGNDKGSFEENVRRVCVQFLNRQGEQLQTCPPLTGFTEMPYGVTILVSLINQTNTLPVRHDIHRI